MSSQIKKDKSSSNNEGKVLISKEAYRNMIAHVLRFGNVALENNVEVAGICLGKFSPNEKDIMLTNAIPFTHGKNVSLGFSKADYEAFEKIEEKFKNQDQNLSIVGWYQSHPGWGLFFSDNAIKNHHFFQTKQKPYGFNIVFDHTLMGKEGKMGFEIYRLDNYEDLMAKEHHTVEFEIEAPNSLEFFKWIQKFVEDSQKKTPILIKEINELIEPTPGDLQEIPISEDEKLEKEKYPSIAPIISGFQEGGSKFAGSFLETFEAQLGEWIENINRGTLKGIIYNLDSLKQMKDKISSGLPKVQNWLNQNIDDILGDFKSSVSTYIDDRIIAQKELLHQSTLTKDELAKELINLIEVNTNDLGKEIESRGSILLDKIENLTKTDSRIEELISNTTQKILEIDQKANDIPGAINNLMTTKFDQLEQDLINEIETFNTVLNSVKENSMKTNGKLQELKKMAESLKEL